ncbi:MAG: hypothetical protein ACR2RD_13410 [Woeseiaceae bacterium]
MNRCAAGILTLSITVAAGCAHSPSEQAPEAEGPLADGSGVIEEQLTRSDLKKMAGCRKERRTGNRIPTWVCGKSKDDREMLGIVDLPNH